MAKDSFAIVHIGARYGLVENPMLVVNVEGIHALVAGLGLDPEATEAMAARACALARWQLTPRVEKEYFADHAASLKLLKNVGTHGDALINALEHLDPLMIVDIQRECMKQRHPSGRPMRFDFEDLLPTLRNLADLSGRLNQIYTRRGRGRPKNQTLDLTVRNILKDIESATDSEVEFQKTRGGVKDPHLKGQAGEFVRDYFRLVDRHVSEGMLIKSIERARMAPNPVETCDAAPAPRRLSYGIAIG